MTSFKYYFHWYFCLWCTILVCTIVDTTLEEVLPSFPSAQSLAVWNNVRYSLMMMSLFFYSLSWKSSSIVNGSLWSQSEASQLPITNDRARRSIANSKYDCKRPCESIQSASILIKSHTLVWRVNFVTLWASELGRTKCHFGSVQLDGKGKHPLALMEMSMGRSVCTLYICYCKQCLQYKTVLLCAAFITKFSANEVMCCNCINIINCHNQIQESIASPRQAEE